ncbi:MAG: alcohol dehydrogenase catalytic domain-containing protein [Solirubrobacterales bacterium]
MRALLYHGRSRLSVGEVEIPAPGPGQVRVKVEAVGMCKSDIYGYSQLNQRRDEVLGEGETLIMGHEAVGHVEQLGPGVSGIEPGQAVAVDPIEGCGECEACRAGATNICPNRRVYGCIPAAPGGFAEQMIAPVANLYPLSGARPLEWGALVEPLTVGEHGVVLAEVGAGERVLVVGGGIIGLGAAFAAARRGAEVTVSEPMPERRRLAAELGLEAISPQELEGREGYAVALDCVARPETIAAGVAATGRLGRLILVGIWADDVPLPISRVVENETTVRGSFAYLHEDFVRVAEWIESTDVDLARLIELRVSFDDVIDAFDRYADGSLDAVRTVFKPA